MGEQTDWPLATSESALIPEKLDCLGQHLRHVSWTALSEHGENGEKGKEGSWIIYMEHNTTDGHMETPPEFAFG